MAIDTGWLEEATDEALVVAFQDGECEVFTQIVETYHGILFARARRQLRSNDDAQDAVQETFLRAYRSLPNFAGQYHLAAWLNRILSNVIADAKRKHGVEVRLQARLAGVRDEQRVPEELAVDGASDGEVRATVESAIASLSADHRDAFMLRAVEDQTYAEIAEVLEISEVNARARVHRARTNLQRTLGKAEGSFGLILITWRGHVAGLFGRRLARGTSSSRKFGAAGSGSTSGVSTRTVTQALSNSTGQALTNIASETSRSLLPVSGTFASLITSAAVVVVGPVSLLPAPVAATQAPVPASHLVVAARSATAAPVIGPPAATPVTAPTTSAVTWPAPATSTHIRSIPHSSAPATPVTTPPTTPVAPVAPSWSSLGVGAGGVAAPLAACPYLQSFPGASPGQVTLPPAESSGPGATNYLSTGTVTVPSLGPSFDVTSLGTLSDGSQLASMRVLFGACGPSTSSPALVANITNNNSPSAGELQLRGALASSSTTGGETDTTFRGTAVWLSGPDVGQAPVVFVANVTTEVPDNTVNLHVAFFGSVNDLAGSPS